MCVMGKIIRKIVKVQRDQEVPVHRASEESERASGMEESNAERQAEIIDDDTALHDQARELLVPDIDSGDQVVGSGDRVFPDSDSGDQVVPEHSEEPGNLEESDLLCDESIDYDTEFPEDNQVTNLEVTDEGAESSAQVANDPVVSNVQSESPGQGGQVLNGGSVDRETMEELLMEITRKKLEINIPPW